MDDINSVDNRQVKNRIFSKQFSSFKSNPIKQTKMAAQLAGRVTRYDNKSVLYIRYIYSVLYLTLIYVCMFIM